MSLLLQTLQWEKAEGFSQLPSQTKMQPFRVEKDKEDVTLGFLHSVSACMIYLHLNAEHSRSLISPCYEFCIEAIYCLIENYLLYQLKSEG